LGKSVRFSARDADSRGLSPGTFQKQKSKSIFETLNRANTYAIAWRLQTVKKPETRAKRMQAILAMLKRGEKLHD
jgi:uncharacterized protein YdeI (YjbR/CyaY-like superfamily)